MEKNKNRLIQTLITGRDSAKKLQNLLRRKVNADGSVSAEEDLLIMEILGSFSGGLSMLNNSSASSSSEMYGSFTEVGLASPVDRSPEVYSGKKPALDVKERRGCYKRRRTIDSDVIIRGTIEDGYAWRKYGQKEILNSKSPRCYFRCTHKHAHGCKALKQVQKLEDNSNMYHITYIGQHTCPTSKILSHHETLLNFEDSKTHYHVSNNPSTITSIHNEPLIKQEVDSKAQSSEISDNVSSANNEYSVPPLKWNEILSGDLGVSFMKFDHEDSCASTSSHGYFMNYFYSDDMLNDSLLQLDQAFS